MAAPPPREAFLDSGSNALYVLNPQILGILDCTDNPYYCPNPTLPVSLTLYGANGNTGTAALNIANADTLFATNPGFAAFNDWAGQAAKGFRRIILTWDCRSFSAAAYSWGSRDHRT